MENIFKRHPSRAIATISLAAIGIITITLACIFQSDSVSAFLYELQLEASEAEEENVFNPLTEDDQTEATLRELFGDNIPEWALEFAQNGETKPEVYIPPAGSSPSGGGSSAAQTGGQPSSSSSGSSSSSSGGGTSSPPSKPTDHGGETPAPPAVSEPPVVIVPPSVPTNDMSKWISGVTKGADGYVSSLTVGSTTLTGHRFRELLQNSMGQRLIRSADFTYRVEGDNFVFTSFGYGHGVGMSQAGAQGYAKNGKNYEWILSHYYPGTSLAKTGSVADPQALAEMVYYEMYASFSDEALRAQAIAIHSWQLHNNQTPTRKANPPQNVVNAVKSVTDVIITYGGSAANTTFFDCVGSAGKTRNAKDVGWSDKYPYLTSVESPYDQPYATGGWQKESVVAGSIIKEIFKL